MEPIEAFKASGWKVEIHYDDDARDDNNPRTYAGNLGVMWATHRSYDLGDIKANPCKELDQVERAYEYFENYAHHKGGARALVRYLKFYMGATVVQPLYLLDHSGLAMSTNRFRCDSDGLDTSMVGFIFDTPRTREESGIELERVEECLSAEVGVYSQYLSGEVYGYKVLDYLDQEIDACWGFIGMDHVTESAHEAAGSLVLA